MILVEKSGLKILALPVHYRKDIDGLRGLAILFVLFFHAGLKQFPSGFIGVDMFFVISGFLITGIIHQSLQNQSFSLIQFYNRRLWRLQPVFICLLVVTALLTLIYYLPDDLLDYFKSARKTSFFTSNQYFGRVTTDYFAANNHQLPLLHTWSLSIEWQCYLILPILFYGLYRLFGEHRMQIITCLLTFLSLAFTLYFSVIEPTKAYYHTSSRLFEFLIGASVALTPQRISINKHVLNILCIFAFTCLFYIATRHEINYGFPNCYALLLCIATSVLIFAGQQTPPPFLTRWLSLKPIVFIGLISYSLYIWHWPLFVLMHYLDIAITTSVLYLALGLTFILAYLSWRYIEKPTRQFNTLKFSYSLIYLIVLPVAFVHLSHILIKKNDGYPQRFEEAGRVNTALKQYANAQRPLCLDEKNVEISPDCLIGSKNSDAKTGFMIGDSYANHHWGFIDTLAKQANLSILAHSTSACLTLPGIRQYNWNKEKYTACQQQTARYFDMIKSHHYDVVLLGQNWNGYLYDKLLLAEQDNQAHDLAKQQIEQSLEQALQIITASGAKPVIIESLELTGSPIDCFYYHIKHRTKYIPEQCDFDISSKAQQWQNDLFSRMKKKYAQLLIIDPKKAHCPNGRCKAEINGIPAFRDGGHVTDYASYHLGEIYLSRFKNPLINAAMHSRDA